MTTTTPAYRPAPSMRLGLICRGCSRRAVIVCGPDATALAECMACGRHDEVAVVHGVLLPRASG